ncbi:MAG: ABC transporter ATP-binding protein [Bacillota bacterium]|nr:ABC transporter ATP-binding protein [Bacillota bacterium]
MAIKVSDVSKSLDQIYTLDHLSLEVTDHEFVVILGPSGCGKSTLFNILSGLMLPDTGDVFIDDKKWTGKTGRVSYMQQKDLLLPSRNILDNVSIPLLLKGKSKAEAREKAKTYLKDFGLEGFSDYYPRQLSGGMKQRAALLRTYLFASDILLLDEPFASLDAISRRKMQAWLKDLQQRYQSSILFVTHDIEEALLLADRIYVFSGRPAQIRTEINLRKTGLSEEKIMEHKNAILSILKREDEIDV